MNFSNLGLSAELQRALREQGYSTPTPIQKEAIPIALEGRDLLAGAQTGTGKTAAFALPLLQHLQNADRRDNRRRPRGLVLAPTRELAAQVEASIRTYGSHLPFRTAVIFGGVNIQSQITRLRRGVDIVVATPGRLLDHMDRRTIDLGGVEILVLDEADRMLDMGFIRDIRKVLQALPARRQNMLFSATFSKEIRQLADDLLNRPTEVQVAARNAAADRISQVAHPVDRTRKRELLSHIIDSGDWRQVLVFTRTKHGANRLSKQLSQDGLSADAIHGNKSQRARTRSLADFKNGTTRILVATDIAARGLDIESLPHVVNFDMPNVPEDYVHRIGRTGRAGEEGRAVSLVSVDERGMLAGIERLLRRDIEQVVVEGFEPRGGVRTSDGSRTRQSNDRGHGSNSGGEGRRNGGGRTGNGRSRGRNRRRNASRSDLEGERWGRNS